MNPIEFELKGQEKLRNLFQRIINSLKHGALDPGLVDQVELLSDELKTNREKIDVSEVDQRKKQIINELITENRRLLKEIISLINLNLEVVESLKSMLDEKTGIYKIVDGKLVEE